jgi:hypothetical protein
MRRRMLGVTAWLVKRFRAGLDRRSTLRQHRHAIDRLVLPVPQVCNGPWLCKNALRGVILGL